jgi:hypothetical protein
MDIKLKDINPLDIFFYLPDDKYILVKAGISGQ